MAFVQAISSLKILVCRIRALENSLCPTDFDYNTTDEGAIASLYSRLKEAFLFIRSKQALNLADKNVKNLHHELALSYYSEVAYFHSTSIALQFYSNVGVCLAKNDRLIEAFDFLQMACQLDTSNSMTVENLILISVLINRFDVAMRSFKQLCHLENRPQSDKAASKLAYMKSFLLRGLVQANLLHEAHALVDYLSRHTLAMDDISPSSIVAPQKTSSTANAAHNRSLQNHSALLLESPCSQSSRLKRESLLQAKQRFNVVLDNIADRAALSSPISTSLPEDEDGGLRQSSKVLNSEATTVAQIPLQSQSSKSYDSQATTTMDNLQHANAKSMKLLINVSKFESLLHRTDQPDDDITTKNEYRYENTTPHGSDGKLNPNISQSWAKISSKVIGSNCAQQVNGLLRTHGVTSNPSPPCDATSPVTISTLSQSNFGTPTAKPAVSLKGEVNLTTSGISDAMEWLTFRHGRRSSPSPRRNEQAAFQKGVQTKRFSTFLSPPNSPTIKTEELTSNYFGTCKVDSEDSQPIAGDGLLSTSKETVSNCFSMEVGMANQNSPPQLPPSSSSPTRSHSKMHNSKVASNPPEEIATNDIQDFQSPAHSDIPAPMIVEYKDSEEDAQWRMDGYEDSPLQPRLRKGSSWTAAKSMVSVANEIRSRVKLGHKMDGHIEYLFLKDSDSTSNGRKNLLSSRMKAPTLSMSAPNTPAVRKHEEELELCTSVGELCISTDMTGDLRRLSESVTVEALSLTTTRCLDAERSIHTCNKYNVMGSHDVDKEGRIVEHQATISINKNYCSSLSLAKTDYKPSSPLEPTGFGRSWLPSSASDGSRKRLLEDGLHSRRPLCDENSHSVPPRLRKTLLGNLLQSNASNPPAAGVADTSAPTLTQSSKSFKSEYFDYDMIHRHVRENFFGGPLSQEDVDPDVIMGSFDILVDVARASQSPQSERGSSSESRGDGDSSSISCHPNAAAEMVIAPRIPRTSISPRFFKYEQLAFPGPYPAGIQLSRRELYLSETDFKRILGVSKEQWTSLPKWRRILKKREKKLF